MTLNFVCTFVSLLAVCIGCESHLGSMSVMVGFVRVRGAGQEWSRL